VRRPRTVRCPGSRQARLRVLSVFSSLVCTIAFVQSKGKPEPEHQKPSDGRRRLRVFGKIHHITDMRTGRRASACTTWYILNGHHRTSNGRTSWGSHMMRTLFVRRTRRLTHSNLSLEQHFLRGHKLPACLGMERRKNAMKQNSNTGTCTVNGSRVCLRILVGIIASQPGFQLLCRRSLLHCAFGSGIGNNPL
jgi:hypothetical protein